MPKYYLALGAQANQSMQPRPVKADGMEIAHARRETFPYPLIQPQIKAGRRLSQDLQARRLRQDGMCNVAFCDHDRLGQILR